MSIEHHIQREIIERLARAEGLRFGELKPAGMESNVFTYHLQQLMVSKMIVKSDSGDYQLSLRGLQYVDGVSYLNLKPRQQPKLISIIALKSAGGSYLMAKRSIQPYIGTYMLPSGKLHIGETAQDHAARELKEKTGLVTDLRLRGVANVQISERGGLLTQVIGYVFSGGIGNVPDVADDDKFSYQWLGLERSDINLMPGTKEIIGLLESSDDLFVEDISASL